VPYRKIIEELEARMKELQAESDALEERLEALRTMQSKVGVNDDTPIISGVEVVESAPQPD
jgi:prefoldin subunit 5